MTALTLTAPRSDQIHAKKRQWRKIEELRQEIAEREIAAAPTKQERHRQRHRKFALTGGTDER